MQVSLRDLEITDAYYSFKWRNDKRVWKYTLFRPEQEITFEQERAWLAKRLKDDTVFMQAILVNDEYIGNIQLVNIENRHAEFHIFIGEVSFHGKGVGKKACRLFYQRVFRKFGPINIELLVHKENINAFSIYQSFDFEIVETLEGGYIKMSKVMSWDLETHGIQKSEFTLNDSEVKIYNEQLYQSLKVCESIRKEKGVITNSEGTVHHLLATDRIVYLNFLKTIFSNDLYDEIYSFFDGNFVLNSFGGVVNSKNSRSYVSSIHRDVRFYTNRIPLMLNVIVLLTEFNDKNGGTRFLLNSHKTKTKPTDQEFYTNSISLDGLAGEIFMFDANLWHAAGINETFKDRNAITLTFTKPSFKPQFDYLGLFNSTEIELENEKIKQVLGYNSRIPKTLHDWYQKPENRFYKSNQD